MNQNFVALTQHPGELDWLQNSLASAGQVVPAGSASLEELLALLDVTAAGVLFISLGKSNLVSQGALVEGLVSARPMLSVVAIGDGLDNQLVLAAMRAGARSSFSSEASTAAEAGATDGACAFDGARPMDTPRYPSSTAPSSSRPARAISTLLFMGRPLLCVRTGR